MTITRIWQSGAESGSLDEADIYNASISTSNPYTGLRCFHCASNTSQYIQKSISATRQVRAALFWNPNFLGRTDIHKLIDITQSDGTTIVSVRQNGSNEKNLYLYIGGSQQDILGSANSDEWFHISIDTKINSSTGWIRVYKDGSLIFSFDGNTGNVDIGRVIFGPNVATASTGAVSQKLDDCYIDDTTGEGSSIAPPIKRLYQLNVNGDGNYLQWTPIPTGSHYLNVDDRPPDDDTSYLEAVTGSLLDSFTMTTFTLDTNEDIIAMIPYTFAKRGSTTEKISLGTRSSGTNLIGVDQGLSTSYNYIWERQTTGSLGSPWNQSYMDSVEVIINSTGTY